MRWAIAVAAAERERTLVTGGLPWTACADKFIAQLPTDLRRSNPGTIAELKDLCVSAGIVCTGSKDEIVEQLISKIDTNADGRV